MSVTLDPVFFVDVAAFIFVASVLAGLVCTGWMFLLRRLKEML
jgi:hypothetical protein